MKPWHTPHPRVTNGLELTRKQREIALKHFTTRHTGQHVPEWVGDWHAIKRYPMPPYNTDRQWLKHSWFYMTKKGEIDLRFKYPVVLKS